MYKTILTIILTIILVIISFYIGLISGVNKSLPYQLAKSVKTLLTDSRTVGLETCDIPKIEKLPKKFDVIIGHAYGAHANSTPDRFVAPSVESFLLANSSSIDKIIFTGDVFSIPSSAKWAKLFEQFGSKISIAPGNHDKERPDSKEIFELNADIRQNYPFIITTDNINIIVTDSVEYDGNISDRLMNLIASQASDVLIARHHVVVNDLRRYANFGFSGLPSVNELVRDINTRKKVTWIMGDGGAFSHLPRITCHQFKNHRFIINGIGEISGDTVLILSEGKLSQFAIQ